MKSTRLLSLLAVLVTTVALAGPVDIIRDAQANSALQGINVLRVASAVADAETVTIGTTVFEVDTASTPTITAGRVRLNCNAAQTATTFTTTLTAVINAGAYGVRATRIGANEVLIIQNRPGAGPIATTETLAGSNNAWAAATTFGAAAIPDGFGGVHLAKRTATAVEVALATMHFVFPFSPSGAIVQITTAGVPKAFDGTVTVTGNRVDLAGGTAAIAAGDVVNVLASE